MHMMNNKSAVTRLKAIKLVSDVCDLPPSQSLFKEMEQFGFIKKLIEFAKNPTHASIQYESMGVLLQIAYKFVEGIIKNDGRKILMQILNSPKHYEIKIFCLIILGCIAVHSDQEKLLLIQNGILVNILKICQLEHNAKFACLYGNKTQNALIVVKSMTASFLDIICRDFDGDQIIKHLSRVTQCLLLLINFTIKHKNVKIKLHRFENTVEVTRIFDDIANITANCYKYCLLYGNGYDDVSFDAKIRPILIYMLGEFTDTMSEYAKHKMLYAASLASDYNHSAMISQLLNANILRVLCNLLPALAFDTNKSYLELLLLLIAKILSFCEEEKINNDSMQDKIESFVEFGGYKSLLAVRKKIHVDVTEEYQEIMDLCLNHFYERLKDNHRKIRKCKYCKRTNHEYELYLCKGCLKVKYCSTRCQKRHWLQHKTQCYLL